MNSVSTVRSGGTLRGHAEQRKESLRRAQGAAKTQEGQDSTEDEETVNWGEVHALGMEQWKEGKPLYVEV